MFILLLKNFLLGRRDSRIADRPNADNVEAKEAAVSDNKNEAKPNKNGYRRRRQFRRQFFKNQKKGEGFFIGLLNSNCLIKN